MESVVVGLGLGLGRGMTLGIYHKCRVLQKGRMLEEELYKRTRSGYYNKLTVICNSQ